MSEAEPVPDAAPAVAGVAGLVLAAGGGVRFGGPKGLARDTAGEPWVVRAVDTLRAAGCAPVLVTVGASGEDVAALVPRSAVAVPVPDWETGLAASVRAGIHAASRTPAAALLIVPVDIPDLPVAAVRRILALADSAVLAQATYDGRPGHPVLLGRDRWAALADGLSGDRGAGPYLRAHGAERIECGDLWHGADVDTR